MSATSITDTLASERTADTPIPARGGVSVMKRVFRMGPTDLPDLAPDLPPEESLRCYEAFYPILKSCTLEPCFEERGVLIYVVRKPPAETKGAL